ncbi:26487_t:CDS:1, partial [Gigaspora margarita]
MNEVNFENVKNPSKFLLEDGQPSEGILVVLKKNKVTGKNLK